jgi:phosphoribosyl-dephospho-CoA transferase
MTRPPALWRQQLVRLSADGWRDVCERDWQSPARDCVAHWAAHDLPLVVTRQPGGPMPAGTVQLGLPAPACWSRLRLALQLPRQALAGDARWPDMGDLIEQVPESARAPWCALQQQLAQAGCTTAVYGSRGWQHLSGLDYVHADSDVDLLVQVGDTAGADAAACLLSQATVPGLRLDGELLMADGRAFAWREWADWRRGSRRSVLYKHMYGAALLQDTPCDTH